MRKFRIALLTVLALLVVFGVYNLLFKTPDIQIPQQTTQTPLKNPDIGNTPVVDGHTAVGEAETSRFTVLDPRTKQVKQVFGFERLLNPEQGSPKRKLLKPFIELYEKNLTARITADVGFVQFEAVAGSQTPKDARLSGNVVIHITFGGDTGPVETDIYLEDLLYSSERSEFSTENAVRLISRDARITGRGMVLIYNAGIGRLEYFKISQLDQLRIRNVDLLSGGSSANSGDKKNNRPASSSATAAATNASDTDMSSDSTALRKDYYDCRFLGDVTVRYGDQLIIVGVDDFVINNILWSSGLRNQNDFASGTQDRPRPDADVDTPAARQTGRTGSAAAGSVEVVITSTQGMIIKPVASLSSAQGTDSGLFERTIALAGRPVCVNRLPWQQPAPPQTIVRCGILKYNIDTDILTILTNTYQKFITLTALDRWASIQTEGDVRWERKSNSAWITGPGKLFFASAGKLSVQGLTEMDFKGMMNLVFADKPADFSSQLILKAVNLTGGMTVSRRTDNSLDSASADSADVVFDNLGRVETMDLMGGVNLASAADNTKTTASGSSAQCIFEDKNLRFVGLTDNVAILFQQGPTLPAEFYAKKIGYDLKTGSATASGPVKFVFYTNPLSGTPEAKDSPPVPFVITADGDADFIANAQKRIEQVILKDNVRGNRTVDMPGYSRHDSFTGDKVTVNLGRASAQNRPYDIAHLVLSGRPARLESQRIAQGQTINHVRLVCTEIDYSAEDAIITAAGPGNIELDNSKASPSSGTKDFPLSLQNPCYARMENFETLEWLLDKNRITARGKAGGLSLGYIPVKQGQLGSTIQASASSVVVTLRTDASGRNDIETLGASGPIYFNEENKHLFRGDALSFDGVNSRLEITGTKDQPCYADGANVPRIGYDLKNGKTNFKLGTSPGSVTPPPAAKIER